MKKPTPSLTRSRAWTCTGINLLAFPGMGTVMAGRRIGYVQAAIMVAGFILVMIVFVACSVPLFHLISDLNWGQRHYDDQLRALRQSWSWAFIWGMILCGIAWCWSLVSSVEILRQARQTPPLLPRNDNLKT
jgi:hypothetical protein